MYAVRVACQLYDGYGHRCSEKLEYYGYSGGGGQAESIEQVKQDYIGQHYCQENYHQVSKIKLTRIENTLPGNFHHSARKCCPENNTKGGNDKDDPQWCYFRSDSRVKKIYSVIADSYNKV